MRMFVLPSQRDEQIHPLHKYRNATRITCRYTYVHIFIDGEMHCRGQFKTVNYM